MTQSRSRDGGRVPQQDLVAAVEAAHDRRAVHGRCRRPVLHRCRRGEAPPAVVDAASAAAERRRGAGPARRPPAAVTAARRRRGRGARPRVAGRMKDDSGPAGALGGEDVGEGGGRRGAGRRHHGVDEELITSNTMMMMMMCMMTGQLTGARRPLHHVVLSPVTSTTSTHR